MSTSNDPIDSENRPTSGRSTQPSFRVRVGAWILNEHVAWVVLFFTLLLTLLVWRSAQEALLQVQQARFENRAAEVSNAILKRMQGYEHVLRGGVGLFAASKSVERAEWRDYIASLKIQEQYPGIQGIGFSVHIPAARLDAHLREIRAKGFPDYAIRPAGVRAEYTSIIYLEPFDWRNQRAFGFDMFSEATRRAAMERARDTGDTAISAKVTLVQETNKEVQAGMLMYLPYYKNGTPRNTLAERRANLVGYVYSPFRLNDLMRGILEKQPTGAKVEMDIDIEVYDGTQHSADNLLYDDDGIAHALGTPPPGNLTLTRDIDVYGHTWSLHFTTRPAFHAAFDKNKPLLFLVVGTLLSMMLSGLIWMFATQRRRALKLASHLNEKIAERKRTEEILRDSEAILSATINTALDAVVQMDEAGIITRWNTQAEEIFGWKQEAAIGRMLHETIIPPQYREAHTRGMKHFLASGEGPVLNKRFEILALHHDGHEFPIEVSITPLKIAGQHEFSAFIRDITERNKAVEELHLAAMVYQNSSEAMSVTDSKGNIVSINPAFTEITGYTLEDVVGRNARILSSGRHDHEFYRAMWEAINSTGQWQGEIWNRRKNGELYMEWLTINAIYHDDGSLHRYFSLFSDITKKKESEELIWQQANFDTLTGLPNRRMFYDRLAQEIKKSHRSNLPMALMLLDLDHFKEVNDTLGHAQGDVLLVEAARRIAGCVRESDTVARLGGDEFIVILSELEDVNSVERIAQSIIERLVAPIQLQQDTAFVSASIGITLYPNDAQNIDTLITNADQAMYLAKNSGRNRLSYFTAALQIAAKNRLRLSNDLRGALADQQFRVFYQPIVTLANGVIHKAEALLRWQHPTRGFISPAEFIPVAEETGMIIDIGDWVFREVASQAAHWRASHYAKFQISVNVSPVQFRHHGTNFNAWLDYLQKLGLPGQNIVMEITEGLLLDADTAVTDQLLAFRDAGIRISLDDFGTGYSSLSYLKKFDIDYLKIDQSFVRDLEEDPDDRALCEAIIVMAHKLGLKVIAEGVETEQQRDLLVAYGCDYAQGWLYSKAVPPEQFEALLHEPIVSSR